MDKSKKNKMLTLYFKSGESLASTVKDEACFLRKCLFSGITELNLAIEDRSPRFENQGIVVDEFI